MLEYILTSEERTLICLSKRLWGETIQQQLNGNTSDTESSDCITNTEALCICVKHSLTEALILWIKKKHFLDLKSVCWIIIVKPTETILLFPLQADCSYGLLPLNKSKTFVALSLCRGYVWWSLILLGWEFCSSDSVAPWGGYEQNNGRWEACCLGHQHLEPTQRTSLIFGSAPSTSSCTLWHPSIYNLMLLLISLTAKVVISKTITQGTGAYPRHQRAEAGGLDPDKSLACHRANTETQQHPPQHPQFRDAVRFSKEPRDGEDGRA